MNISVVELEKCFEIILQHVRLMGINSIETTEEDFYWTVLSYDWLQFDKEPALAVGSLDDDILELKKIITEPSRTTSVDIERLSAILKLLSERLSEHK